VRTVTYGAACSLDAFIAGENGALDWLHFSSDVQAIMAGYWETIDAVVMGRKTYEIGGARQSKLPTYVFSRTLRTIPEPHAHLVASDPGEFVGDLKRQPGKGICVLGGGELAQSLLAAGVVDVIGLNIHPLLLGSGVPLFRDTGRRIALELTESRPIDGGCVYASYRVRSGGGHHAH
jgi:dihydrofolate reductase